MFCSRNCAYYDETEWSYVEDDYIPMDELAYCAFKNEHIFSDHAQYCSEAEDYFHEDYYDEWLEEWKEKNWEWDEYNHEYVEETSPCYVWNDSTEEYDLKNVETSYAEEQFYDYEGEWYNEVNEEGIPYHLVEKLEAV